MAELRTVFPFEFVLMVGDNLYGRERAADYARKFELPYAPLLEQDVEFYAALGNHDNPNQRFYEPFHMQGRRYYAFEKGDARFFALDSNYMDEEQIEWLRDELERSDAAWKICFFHHPPYSSGGFHGSEIDLRQQLEPLFVQYGVRVVFSGHEHFYEHIRPQKGVHYFISGAGAKLRAGDIRRTPLTATGFDSDLSFVLVEIHGDLLRFEVISRAGRLVDSGEIPRLDGAAPAHHSAVWPGFRIQTDPASRLRRITSSAMRRGGSSYGSRARAKVPQWMPRNRAARRSRPARSASSGETCTGCASARGV
jgi:hypothetical protein